MANIIRIRRSSTAGTVPAASTLAHGELAVNTADGKLFYGKSDGSTGTFSSGGGSALDANNNLPLPAATAVSTVTAGNIAERVITRAGFSQLGYANASLAELVAQPSLEQTSLYKLEAGGNANILPLGCTATVSGGGAALIPTFSSYVTSKLMYRMVTTTTAGSTALVTSASCPYRYRGSGARQGGFWFIVRFQPILLTGHQAVIGAVGGTGVLSGEPSAVSFSTIVGLICDSTDTNWQFYSRGVNSSSGTKVDTGLAKTATGSLLALYVYVDPAASGIVFELQNESTQSLVSSTAITTNLPAATDQISGTVVKLRNGTTTTVGEIQFNMLYNSARY